MNRFDLEQSILKCWTITDDIDTLYGTVFEREMSKDELANYLLGLKTIYDIKFNQLFSIFENMIAKGMIRDA